MSGGLTQIEVPLLVTFFHSSLTSFRCAGWIMGLKQKQQVCDVRNSFVIATGRYRPCLRRIVLPPRFACPLVRAPTAVQAEPIHITTVFGTDFNGFLRPDINRRSSAAILSWIFLFIQ